MYAITNLKRIIGFVEVITIGGDVLASVAFMVLIMVIVTYIIYLVSGVMTMARISDLSITQTTCYISKQ